MKLLRFCSIFALCDLSFPAQVWIVFKFSLGLSELLIHCFGISQRCIPFLPLLLLDHQVPACSQTCPLTLWRSVCVTAFRGGWHFLCSCILVSQMARNASVISCMSICQCSWFCHQMVGISHTATLSCSCVFSEVTGGTLSPTQVIHTLIHLCHNVNCFLQGFLYEVVNSLMIYSLLTPSVCKQLLCVDSNKSFFYRANGTFLLS